MLVGGRGKYGVVKLCRHKETGQKYAAKYIRKQHGSRGVSMVDIKREMDIMNQVKGSQFLMGLFDAYENPTFVIFVVDLYVINYRL